MSFSQAAVLMDMLNSQSRELALTFGWHYVDVPACFSRFQSGDLFYDSVHYTLQGSKQFADCVNRDVGDGTGVETLGEGG